MNKIVLVSIFLTSLIKISEAQSSFVGGIFPTIDHSGSISKKWEYSLYYFAALPLVNFSEPKDKMAANFLLFYSEQALTYHLNKNLSFSASYVYQRENVLRDNYSNENRIHVQSTYKHSIKKINIKHRLRFDNRFVHNRTNHTTPYTHRLRYLIGLDFLIKNNLYFTAYQEAFFNSFQNATAIYGENWTYLGIGYQFNDKHKIETGPLYITWNTGEKAWFHQWYLQMTWISKIDFTKSKMD